MISWIQRSFQSHFKVVFGLLLAATVISFIISIGAASGALNGGRGGQAIPVEKFFGHNLASEADKNQIYADGDLSYLLRRGTYPQTDKERDGYALERAAALSLADSLHLPTPALDSPDVIAYIHQLGVFRDSKGQFDPQAYAEFQENVNSGRSRFNAEQVARVMTDDTRVESYIGLLSGPGFVLPADVKSALEDADTSWTIATADVDYDSFHPNIAVTDAALAQYFKDNQFRYTIAPRVSAGYVNFPTTAYLSRVSVTAAEVRDFYNHNPGRFPKPAPAKVAKSAAPKLAKPDADADFAAVRPQVELALKMDRARSLAAKDASDFAFALYQNKVDLGAPLDQFLAGQHLRERPLVPFTQDAGSAELGGSPDISTAAFQLTADRYYSEGLTTPTGAIVLLWHNTIPTTQPPLSSVTAKVKADYIEGERRRQFVALGSQLKGQLAQAIKSGQTFEKAATAAARTDDVKITPKTWPAFSIENRPAGLDGSVVSELDHVTPGAVSDMTLTTDQGYLVYVIGKKLPDLTEHNPRYAQIHSRLASYFAQMSAYDYLQQLTDREKAKAEAALQ